jgi:hypothetical protein
MKQLWKQWLRKCHICKEIKPLDNEHFYKKKSDNYWYDYKCKLCNNIRDRSSFKWYVYIIKCNDNYKIWVTKNNDINKRIDNMQCWNPYKLSLHKMYYVLDMFYYENKLHKHFNKKNIRWEWYNLNFEDLLYINTILN